MSKKYRDRYDYQNHITICPNCGAELSDDSTDCQACGINLVGYNEQHNMAKNMSDYAEEMQEIVEQNDKLNAKIKKENKKIEVKSKIKKRIFAFVAIVIGCFFLAILVDTIVANIMTNINAQTKEEVIHYLNSTSAETIETEALKIVEWKTQKELHDKVDSDWMLSAFIGYDEDSGTTIIKEMYSNNNKEYSVLRLLPKDVARLPKIEIQLGEIDYVGSYRFVDFDDYFVTTDKSATTDNVFVDEFIFGDENFISRLPTMIINNTEIHMYDIGTPYEDTDGGRVVAIVKLDDGVFYISELTADSTYDGEDVVRNNIDVYFQIIAEGR